MAPSSALVGSLHAAEVANAIHWYDQPDINQAASFVRQIERTDAQLTSRPELYRRVESEIRRAVLRRFPYSLFYVIENDLVIVLARISIRSGHTSAVRKAATAYSTAEIGELIEGESRIDASRPTPVLTTLRAHGAKVVA